MILPVLGFGAAALLAGVLGLAATRPGSFRCQRATLIQAAPESIFALLADFRHWEAWSPYERLDPGMQRTYGGSPSGQGAHYAWNGNAKGGEGRMEILATTIPTHLVIQLDFIRPFAARNTSEFTLEPEGAATRVTWIMHGPSPYMQKLMGLFLNLDQLLGKDFEAGLAALKALAER